MSNKAIYKPTGKAGEYAEWACSLYVGCSNDCSYCYCKRGVLGTVMGAPMATLKKCFKDVPDAVRTFIRELNANLDELRRSSLFFTFTSDPCLPETRALTLSCALSAVRSGVPVQILTKRADFIDDIRVAAFNPSLLSVGFTLTGRDDLEPGASANEERIAAMEELHGLGYRTYASLEPVVDPLRSLEMFRLTRGFCDLYKVGLQSGRDLSSYERNDVEAMAREMMGSDEQVYLKHSLTRFLGWPPMEPVNIFHIAQKNIYYEEL